jgi:hypothetical protein
MFKFMSGFVVGGIIGLLFGRAVYALFILMVLVVVGIGLGVGVYQSSQKDSSPPLRPTIVDAPKANKEAPKAPKAAPSPTPTTPAPSEPTPVASPDAQNSSPVLFAPDTGPRKESEARELMTQAKFLFASHQRERGMKKLGEIVERYPATKAASDAKELLATR